MNKLIFISNDLEQVKKVTKFAKSQHYTLIHYSEKEWNSKQANDQNKNPPPLLPRSQFSVLELPTNSDNLLRVQTMQELKIEAIKVALLKARGNVSNTANLLKIGRATLYRKIKELEIDLESMRKNINEEEPQQLKKTA